MTRVKTERTEKAPAQDSLQITKAEVTSSQECREFSEDEGLEKETVVDVIERQKVERSAENSVIPAQYTITKKANEGEHQECSVFAEDEQLELESATMQRRSESSGNVLIAAASYSVQTAGHGANYLKQESGRNAENAHLEANAALHQKSETSTKFFISNSKSDQSYEVLEDNIKIREKQEIIIQKGSEMPKNVLETREEYGTRENEASSKEQMLLKMMGNFFNQQQMKILHQENTHSFDNSEEIEPRQLGETTSSEESKDTRNVCPQDFEENMTECLPKSGYGVLTRSRESKEDAIVRHLGTKEDSKLKYGMNSHRRESQDIANQKPKVNICGHRKPVDAIMRPQKIKDYVTVLPRESDDATVRPQNPEDHGTFIPRISDDHILPSSQWKDYVTIYPTGQKENIRMPPRPVPEITEPPTHIFWRVRPFREIEHFPKEPTRVHWPLQRFQKTTSGPQSEPDHVPLQTRHLEEENREASSPPLPSRTRSNLARILQCQRLSQAPDEDDLPLVFFEQGPVAAGETEEPRVQKNRGILDVLPPLPIGILDCMQRIRECYIPSDRRAFFETSKTRCWILLCSVVIIVGIFATVLYFTKTVAKSESLTSDSNITTPYYLDSNETAFVTNLDVKVTDFDCGVTTPVNDFDVSVTTPMRDLAVNVVPPIKYIFFNLTSPAKDC